MGAGRFHDKVELQALVETDDGYGGVVGAWATYATVWADFRERPGGRSRRPDTQETSQLVECRIRQSTAVAAVSEGHRVIARSRQWDIINVAQPGRVPDVWLLTLERQRFGDAT